jgi:hypothetical protein
MNDWALVVNVRFRAQMVIIAERKKRGIKLSFFSCLCRTQENGLNERFKDNAAMTIITYSTMILFYQLDGRMKEKNTFERQKKNMFTM